MRGFLAILGPGALGQAAAQWAAECGLEVKLLGRSLAHAEEGLARIRRRLDRAVAHGRISPNQGAGAADRLAPAMLEPEVLQEASILLEALPEDPDAKIAAWSQVAAWDLPHLLLLSGTSSLPISRLAQGAGLSGRLLGFHLFLPVERMALVELAVPPATQPHWVEAARSLGAQLRKRVIQVKDQPGFAAARMALAQGLEAMRLLEAGVASAEDLDALMTLGYGHPVGPLELSDRIGLDLRLQIASHLAAAGEPRFAPPTLLRTLVGQGRCGRRSGQGFFRWPASRSTE